MKHGTAEHDNHEMVNLRRDMNISPPASLSEYLKIFISLLCRTEPPKGTPLSAGTIDREGEQE